MFIPLVFIVPVVALLGYAATRPDSFRISRSIRIRASADRIVPWLADFHRWASWSPWEKIDADLKKKYSGAASGVGTVYEWEGKKTGTGRMEILETSPALTKVKLDFVKPFEAHNIAEFTLEPDGDHTNLTWSMYGPSPFMSKLMGVFMSMDKLVGKDFEKGLADLKNLAENQSEHTAGSTAQA